MSDEPNGIETATEPTTRRGRPPKAVKVRPNYSKENAALQARIDVAVDLLEVALDDEDGDSAITVPLVRVALKRLKQE